MIHCVPPTSAKGTRCKIIKSRCKGGKGLCALSSSPFLRRNPHNRGHFPSLFKLLQTIFFLRGIRRNKDNIRWEGFLFYIYIHLFCYLFHLTVKETKTPQIHGTLNTNHWQHRSLKKIPTAGQGNHSTMMWKLCATF